jgi:hypothetical protein
MVDLDACEHPQTPWMRIWKWKQWRNELSTFLTLQHFEGKRGMLELLDGD